MRTLHLGSLLLCGSLSNRELAARGISPDEPAQDAVFQLGRELCRAQGADASRIQALEFSFSPAGGTLLCRLAPPARWLVRFGHAWEALDALGRLPSLRRCVLWADADGYVTEVRDAQQAAVLLEFGKSISDAEAAERASSVRLAAQEHILRRLLRRENGRSGRFGG